MSIILRRLNLVDILNGQIKERANIVIEKDIIVNISYDDKDVSSKQFKVMDCKDCFAIPGLIDLHTHLIWSAGSDPVRVVEEEGIQVSLIRAAFNARKTLETGITCVRDLGSNENATISLSKAVSQGYTSGPRIISSGCTLIMTGGHDPFWGEQVDGKAELVKTVRKQIYRGAKVIKVSATGGVYGRQEGEDVGTAELTSDEMRAVCEEAHRFGLKVAAHAISEEGIWNCIEAGIDTIEHGHFLTAAAMDKMKEKNMFWIPTLYVYRQIAEGKNLPSYAVAKAKKIVETHRRTFKAALTSGVHIGCGSDAGSPNTPHGSLINELEYMVEYGCDAVNALRAATLTNAHALGMEKDLGSLEMGKKADILILKENPVENISNIRKIHSIFKGGELI